MPYSTQSDLQQAVGGGDRLLQLADWNRDRAVDVDVVANSIAEADALIDSHICKQFRVPLTAPIPADIVKVSARLARYFLLSSRGMLDQAMTDAYDRDVKWLEGVRDGLISIGVDPAPQQSSMRIDSATPRSSSKEVSRQKLRGFS